MHKRIMVAAVAVLLSTIVSFVALPSANAQDTGITAQTNSGLSMRIGPGTQYSRILIIPSKTTVPVLARSADSQWVMVNYQGIRGWCAAWLTTITGDLNAAPVSSEIVDPGVIVTTNYITKMRGGPGTQFAEIGRIPSRTVVKAVARNQAANWLLVDYNGGRGWIAGWLVTVRGSVQSLPVDDGSGTVPPSQPTPVAPNQPVPVPTQPTGASGYLGTYLYTNTARVKQVYQLGRALGRRPNAFSKVGDSESANQHFLQPFSSPHDLGAYAYLETEIAYFGQTGSFSRTGIANVSGATPMSVLDPLFANPQLCKPTENQLTCEFRHNNPSVVIILLRTFNAGELGKDGVYHQALRQVVKTSIDAGVIPVLSTVPHHIPILYSETIVNDLIRSVAKEYQVPLWDLWASTETLPSWGIDFDGPNRNHLQYPPDGQAGMMTGDYLQYGKNRRNLEALEILNILHKNVIK